MTYQDMYNTTLASIKSACWNVSNYAGLPAEFKAGYSRSYSYARARLSMSIANPIGEVTASTVDSQFSSFIQNTFVITPSATVDQRGMITFFEAVAMFCVAKVKICSSMYNTGKYIVYDANGSARSITRPTIGNIISHYDANNICENVLGAIIADSNAMFIRYTPSVWLA